MNKFPINKPLEKEQLIELLLKLENEESDEYITLVQLAPYKFLIELTIERKDEYFTLSRHGLLHVSGDSAHLTSIEQLRSEIISFNLLTNIPFFSRFRLWKPFNSWRRLVRRKRFLLGKKAVIEELFLAKQPLLQALQQLHEMMYKWKDQSFLKFQSNRPLSLDQFMQVQNEKCLEVKAKLDTFHDTALEIVSAACGTALPPQQNQQAPSQQMQLKRVCKKLERFVRVVCYYLNNWLFNLLVKSLDKLRREVGGEPVFIISCSWKEEVRFSHDYSAFSGAVDELVMMWKEMIFSFVSLSNEIIIRGRTSAAPSLRLILEADKEVDKIVEEIKYVLQDVLERSTKSNEIVETLTKYVGNKSEVGGSTAPEFEELFTTFNKEKDLISKLERSKEFGCFRVDYTPFIIQCEEKVDERLEQVKLRLRTLTEERIKSVKKLLGDSLHGLEKVPESVDEHVQLLLNLDKAESEGEIIVQEIHNCAGLVTLINQYEMEISCNPDLETAKELLLILDSKRKEMLERKGDLRCNLLENMKEEIERIDEIVKQAKLFVEKDDILEKNVDEKYMREKLEKVLEVLQMEKAKMEKFNSFQEKFGLQITCFDSLQELIEFTKWRRKIWEMVALSNDQITKWEGTPFKELKVDELKKCVAEWLKVVAELEVALPPNPLMESVKQRVESVNKEVEWMELLQSPHLTEKYFKEIENSIGFGICGDGVTLKLLVGFGIADYIPIIEEIVCKAEEEAKLQVRLEKVENSWKNVRLTLRPYKETFILGESEAVEGLIAESEAEINSIASSKGLCSLQSKVKEWRDVVNKCTLVLEEWRRCQRIWLQLASVFSSHDIQRLLPNEWKIFRKVDKSWRELMGKLRRNPAALHIANSAGLPSAFRMNRELLVEISKALGDYLDSKRMAFPRLYFISDEDLLEIIGNTATHFVSKCFDGVDRLKLENGNILGVVSGAGQVLAVEKVKGDAKVEAWLGKLETGINKALRNQMILCLKEQGTTRIMEMLDKFPSQVNLVISHLVWSHRVNQALKTIKRGKGLGEVLDSLGECVEELVKLVRRELSPRIRTTLSALITRKIHEKEVTFTLMKNQVSKNDFEWQRHLRYEWDNRKSVVIAKMGTAEQPYGYEYLGSCYKLVMSPLTDRCFLSLMTALQHNFSCALVGPSCSGKRETVLGLANNLGVRCVEIKWKSDLDWKDLGRILSGMVQTGCWLNLTSFETARVKTLSLLAQHLQAIKLAKKEKLVRFVFEGVEMKLRKHCALFLSGKSWGKAPDNLKAVFRQISMALPDCEIIVDIYLRSEGFQNSLVLAKKMCSARKSLNDVLSPQPHYQFGFGMMMKVVEEAVTVNKSTDEFEVVGKALAKIVEPQLVSEDVPVFKELMEKLFPVIFEEDQSTFKDLIKCCAIEMGIYLTDYLLKQVSQLNEALKTWKQVILVGPAGGGKSTLCTLLSSAIKVKRHVIFHQTFLLNEVLERKHETSLTGEIFKAALIDEASHWIIFDGPILTELEIDVELPDKIRVIYEVDNVEDASPALISRSGLIYVNLVELLSPAYSWLEKSSLDLNVKEILKSLFEEHLEAGMVFIKENCKVDQSDGGKVSTLLSLLQALLDQYPDELEKLFLFAYVWALGGDLEEASFPLFDAFVRKQFENVPDGSVFDCIYFMSGENPRFVYDPKAFLPDMIVPTEDVVKLSFLTDLSLRSGRSVLLTGGVGCRKSTLLKHILKRCESENFSTEYLQFSGQTKSKTVQELIEGQLKNYMKGDQCDKKLIVTIDDLNYKQIQRKEENVLEFLRQLLDSKGFYERGKWRWREVENVRFVGTCASDFGSLRILRHFTILKVAHPSKSQLESIYQSIIRGFLNEFPGEIKEIGEDLLSPLISVYEYVREMYRPKPSAAHYIFNLHHLSKWVRGFMQAKAEAISKPSQLIHLFWHEGLRVFSDCFVTPEEKEQLKFIINEKWMVDVEKVESLIFGTFMEDRKGRKYEEISEAKVANILQRYLDELNACSKAPMTLLFFPQFSRQVVKIARVLGMDREHVILLGESGRGKRTMARLAAFIKHCKVISVVGKGWTNGLEKRSGKCGTVVLFNETQIERDGALDEINEVVCGEQTPPNLHLIICISPREKFWEICRDYPQLMSRCSINVVEEWSGQALKEMGVKLLENLGMEAARIAEMGVFVHETAVKATHEFNCEAGASCYVTPACYLELIKTFRDLLREEKEKKEEGKQRIQNGLAKITETTELVKQMRSEIKELESRLVQKSQAVKDLLVVLSEDQGAAEHVRRGVHVEELSAKEKASDTQAIAEDAEKDLAEALPALESAVKSLDTLEKADITQLKQFQKPPELVRTVMEAVCILFGLKADWPTAKVLIGDQYFLKKLYDFDKDDVSESTIKKLKVYIDNPNFTPKKVEKVSRACMSVCMWVRAIELYAKVYKTVEPKRSRYLSAQSELDTVMETLRGKQDQLNEVEKRISSLRQRYETSMKDKQNLEENLELTGNRLRRAAKFTSAFASEQKRWAEAVNKFDLDLKNLVGDCFVTAACLIYAGPFNSKYRNMLVTKWVKRCQEVKIPVTSSFAFSNFADEFEMRVWNSHGLATDTVSIENGLLAKKGHRWPLIIDPEGEANRWLKALEKDIKVMKFNDLFFWKKLKKCVSEGETILIEEVAEIPDYFHALLNRQTFLKDGRTHITINKEEISFSKDFRLYMTTLMPDFHLTRELWAKVNVVNFSITLPSLEDQLLTDVVGLEKPDLESQRQGLASQINLDKNELISLETQMLRLLFQCEGNILDDEELIQALIKGKDNSTLIGRRQSDAQVALESINKTRDKYRSVARRGTALFSFLKKLPQINPIYQFPLKYFRQIFNESVGSSVAVDEEVGERLIFLKQQLTTNLHLKISLTIFYKDKLIFSFMMAAEVMKREGRITERDWSYFLNWERETIKLREKPEHLEWIGESEWNHLCVMGEELKPLNGFVEATMENWMEICLGSISIRFCHPAGHRADVWNRKLSNFHKLLLVRCLIGKQLMEGLNEFILAELGEEIASTSAPSLSSIYNSLDKSTPLLFVHEKGEDAADSLFKLATDMSLGHRLRSLSLGEGQTENAERVLKLAMTFGDWVFLQNVELVPSWLPSLDKLTSQTGKKVNKSFRLFLSSKPTAKFPLVLLQRSLKLAVESPKGIKANVRKALVDVNDFEEHFLGNKWRKLVFSLCFFHSLLRERINWNMLCHFSQVDQQYCLENAKMLCQSGRVEYKALHFMTSEIIYSHVSDTSDKIWVSTILDKVLSNSNYKLEFSSKNEYLEYTNRLQLIDDLSDFFDADKNGENEVETFLRKVKQNF